MQEEHEKLLKALMKDPEYQAMIVDIMQNPEIKKLIQTEMKNKDFRAHLQKVITETFSSPLFKAKIEDILIKAAEEMQGEKKKLMRKSQAKSKQHEGLNRPSSQFRNDFPCNIHIHFSDRMIFSIY